MVKFLVPLILLIMGVGGGVGAGLALKPDEQLELADDMCAGNERAEHEEADIRIPEIDRESEFAELHNQFIIPVVDRDLVEAMVVLSLSVETVPGMTEVIYRREPKLRDALLQVLFDHANMGGFRGVFTSSNNMDVLRMSLTEAAQTILGKDVLNVIVTDIVRQDV